MRRVKSTGAEAGEPQGTSTLVGQAKEETQAEGN